MRLRTLLVPTLALAAIAAPAGPALAAAPSTAHGRVSPALQDVRAANRALRRALRTPDVPIPPILRKIAQCESGGDPRAIGGGGTYRGKYQFMRSTWEAVGGHGDPAAASEAEQDRRAAILLARSGPGQWPVCSR